jgi:hypothetical protein
MEYVRSQLRDRSLWGLIVDIDRRAHLNRTCRRGRARARRRGARGASARGTRRRKCRAVEEPRRSVHEGGLTWTFKRAHVHVRRSSLLLGTL